MLYAIRYRTSESATMKNARRILLTTLASAACLSAQSAVVLTGTIRDFCVPTTGSCTAQPGFEGGGGGLITGMVAPTLTGGLPTAGSSIATGGTTATDFAKWYVTTPGVNLPIPTSLTLTEGPAGTFSYSNGSFFPIDGLGWGNQGRSHNYHFTMHLEGLLAFSDPTAGADKTFTFTGDDDLWIFVDGKLVLDLGGVHGATTGSFTEETLKSKGLSAGTAYDLDIFFAERHTVASSFAITTTLDISAPSGVPEPTGVLLVGTALLGLAASRRQMACKT